MKRYLVMLAIAATPLLAACGKKENTPAEPEADPRVQIEIVGIADNGATVKASLTEGKFYGAKVLKAERISDVAIDYTKEIQLIKLVEEKGVAVDALPCEIRLEKLKADKDYLSAIIVYDATGRACHSAFDTWTALGNPDGLSDENSAGSLTDHPQN